MHCPACVRRLTEVFSKVPGVVSAHVTLAPPEAHIETTGAVPLTALQSAARGAGNYSVAEAEPTDAVFRTNHASNYLPIGGRLPHDRDAIVELIDAALQGDVRLRPEWARGL